MFAFFFFKMENMPVFHSSPFSAFTANVLAADEPVRAFPKPEILTSPKQSESLELMNRNSRQRGQGGIYEATL